MNAFAKAIETGLEQARKAEVDLTGVKQVVAELSAAMEEATGGKMKVVLSKPGVEEFIVTVATVVRDAFGQHQGLIFADRRYVLEIYRIADAKAVSLAELELRPSVFPCLVTFDRQRTSCDELSSLREILTEILASPTTGRAILMLQEPSSA